jgi:flagellar motor switch protein FliN
MKERALSEAVARELAVTIADLLDQPATATANVAGVSPKWIVKLTFAGPLTGAVSVGFGEDGGRAIAQLVTDLEEAPPEASIRDTLLEICVQSTTSLGQRDPFKGLTLAGSELVVEPPAGAPLAFDLAVGDRVTCPITLWDQSLVTATRRGSADPAGSGLDALPPNLDVILDIDLPLSVRFGQTEMTLQALTQVAPGSVIDLGRSPDDPVDVLVHGRLVARGEVVVVSGNYGVRITDLVSAADRLRTVAG